MGVEPPSGTGPSARADASAHDRVCSALPLRSEAATASSAPHKEYADRACAPAWESRPLFWSRLCSPARWHTPLSSRAVPRVHERRREADGGLRVVYAASIRSCRPCPLREQCQWQGSATTKPRQVSVLLHPLVVGSAPLLWSDWSRRVHRRVCMQLLRHQRVDVQMDQALSEPHRVSLSLSRAQRAHYRLSWQERLARNARTSTSGRVTVRLFGVPETFATSFGLSHRLNMRVFGKACVGPTGEPLAPMRTQLPGSSFARADPVERLVRDAVLSEKEAQLGCVFPARDAWCTTGALHSSSDFHLNEGNGNAWVRLLV